MTFLTVRIASSAQSAGRRLLDAVRAVVDAVAPRGEEAALFLAQAVVLWFWASWPS